MTLSSVHCYFEHVLVACMLAAISTLTSFTCSDLRQIPDHQEVYLDKEGFTSITFDILERVDSVANDEEALKYHLEDMTDSEGHLQVLSSGSVKLSYLGCVQCSRNLTKESWGDIDGMTVVI